jgi:hypothetical protein
MVAVVYKIYLPAILACKVDGVCPYHAVIDKEWYAANGNKLSSPPVNLPPNYAITAQSQYGTATCVYPAGSSILSCTYVNNQSPSNLGLWIPYRGTYTVTETGLPQGWTGVAGIGGFTLDSGYCAGTFQNLCLHTVKNRATVIR